MAKIAENILDLVGDTPVVRLKKFEGENHAELYAKLEFFNPLGSVKDRISFAMIEDAEKQGRIKPGDTIVEASSGNTGIGLAFVCAQKDYKLIVVMPKSTSIEAINIVRAFGAEIILTEPSDSIEEISAGMTSSAKKAQEIADKYGYFQPQQFKNPVNPEVHRKTTAKEIIEQVPELDAFVAGIGTGGTITGVGEVLKKRNKNIRIIGVEPKESAVISGCKPGKHKIQGIGAGFIPIILNTKIIDEVIQVSEQEAMQTAKQLIKKEGIFAGISSGANLFAALQVAKKLGKGKKVLVVIPDTGERHLSTLSDFKDLNFSH